MLRVGLKRKYTQSTVLTHNFSLILEVEHNDYKTGWSFYLSNTKCWFLMTCAVNMQIYVDAPPCLTPWACLAGVCSTP